MSNSKEELREINRIISGRKKHNGVFAFLGILLLVASGSYIVTSLAQLLLLLLWGVYQTKLQIFVVVTFLILINSLKLTFSWKLK